MLTRACPRGVNAVNARLRSRTESNSRVLPISDCNLEMNLAPREAPVETEKLFREMSEVFHLRKCDRDLFPGESSFDTGFEQSPKSPARK